MTPKVLKRNAKLERLAIWCTYIALFFNPLGFDFVQYWLFKQTGSIWGANMALYILAGLFFTLSWIFRLLKKTDRYKEDTKINIRNLDENT